MKNNEYTMEQFTRDQEAKHINLNTEYMVAMANDMIKGTSKLNLNELKLLRTIIMQVKREDNELYEYEVPIIELSKLLNIDSSNLYREVDKMTTHLMSEVIRIGDGNPKHSWQKFQWVSRCKYNNGIIKIQLHPDLKPYLTGLRKWYTQYSLEDIVHFKSVYTIHIYELIMMALESRPVYANNTAEVYLDVNTIRNTTGTQNKYEKIDHLKKRVVYPAIEELNEKSKYYIQVRDDKINRKIIGFYFLISSTNSHLHRISESQQMSIDDYLK